MRYESHREADSDCEGGEQPDHDDRLLSRRITEQPGALPALTGGVDAVRE
jgi:hypothetical protein